MINPPQHLERLARARISLEGLSVGDAMGERFFLPAEQVFILVRERALPNPMWRYTDDTNIALSIYAILRQFETINQDALAQSFAQQYHPMRGYGPAMHGLLGQIALGIPWRGAAQALFSGTGSYGNGAAMRVAPLGGYFADDIPTVVEQAHLSAEVTHAHPEGIAGAIAVAVGAAVAWQAGEANQHPTRQEFITQILPHMPESEVRSRLQRAHDIAESTQVEHAAAMLGSGYGISAQDTVPFVLWCAGEYLDDYEAAIWQTIRGLGDVDTTCAMVGGIVALYTDVSAIPEEWLKRREPLPQWAFEE